jgi:exodeoxyribonuclease VII small subunit
MTDPTELTFEAGYERLQAIAERLNKEEVPVSEMCDLFAEGKGLEQALSKYLDTQSQRIETIERGEEIQAFRIVPPGSTEASADADFEDEFVPAGPTAKTSPSPGNDDIPF